MLGFKSQQHHKLVVDHFVSDDSFATVLCFLGYCETAAVGCTKGTLLPRLFSVVHSSEVNSACVLSVGVVSEGLPTLPIHHPRNGLSTRGVRRSHHHHHCHHHRSLSRLDFRHQTPAGRYCCSCHCQRGCKMLETVARTRLLSIHVFFFLSMLLSFSLHK